MAHSRVVLGLLNHSQSRFSPNRLAGAYDISGGDHVSLVPCQSSTGH